MHPGLVATPVLFGGLWEGAQGLFRFARVTGGGVIGGGSGGRVAADAAPLSDALAADPDALQLSSGGWLGLGL